MWEDEKKAHQTNGIQLWIHFLIFLKWRSNSNIIERQWYFFQSEFHRHRLGHRQLIEHYYRLHFNKLRNIFNFVNVYITYRLYGIVGLAVDCVRKWISQYHLYRIGHKCSGLAQYYWERWLIESIVLTFYRDFIDILCNNIFTRERYYNRAHGNYICPSSLSLSLSLPIFSWHNNHSSAIIGFIFTSCAATLDL